MRRVKRICRSLGWELILFAIPLLLMLFLTWKVINDFLNLPTPTGDRPRVNPGQFQNILILLMLAHGVHMAHKHLKRKRKHRKIYHGKL